MHLQDGLGFEFSLKEQHQSADHLLFFFNSNSILSIPHCVSCDSLDSIDSPRRELWLILTALSALAATLEEADLTMNIAS